MARIVKFADLVAKVQQGTVTAAEFRDWFVEDKTAAEAFTFHFTLNLANVDVSGVEEAARRAAPDLAAQANRVIANRQSLARRRAVQPNGTIVAEGDSWFRLPWLYPPSTLIDVLQLKYPINNLAHWGHELATMVAEGQYLPYLNRNLRFLLFSGGGNDILGNNFTRLLRPWDSEHDDPQFASYYLRPEFDQELSHIESYYVLIARQVAALAPNAKLVVHGYDYVIPRNRGIFLGDKMEQDLNLHPYYNGKLCTAILALMIDRFNARLARLQATQPNFVYLNLRKRVGANGWFDEIHPTSAAARTLARHYEKILGAPVLGRRTAGRRTRIVGQADLARAA